MAYTDLFGSDVLAYWKFDSTLLPTSGTYDSTAVADTGAYSFASSFAAIGADKNPINDNTTSLYRTSGGAEQVVVYSEANFNTPLQAPFTLEMWVNYNIDNDSSLRPEANMPMYNAAGAVVGGIFFNSGYFGYYTGNTSRTISNGTLLFQDKWNHLAVVYPDTNAKNAKFYLNGILLLGAPNANDVFPGLDAVTKIVSPKVRAVGSSGGSGDSAAIAVQDAIVTNRALSKEEIAKKARYRNGDTDLYTTIAAKNPYVWYKFDNIVPGTASIYNDGTYVGTNTNPDNAGIISTRTYNLPGIEDTEGIRNTFIAANNGISVSNTKQNIRRAIWNSTKGGQTGFTFEWWQKTPPMVSGVSNAAKTLFNIVGSGGSQTLAGVNVNTGFTSAGATTMRGIPNVTQPYVSGTTGNYSSGSLSTTSTNLQYVNYADGEWHHMVYTFDYYATGTGKAQNGKMYVDGEVVRSRTFTSNANSYGTWLPAPLIDEFANYVDIFITGSSGSYADDGRYFTFDNFVFYDYALSINQIRDNYYAWTVTPYALPPATGDVRYWDGAAWVNSSAQKVWNGTAWVDWNASYYNGTSWISI